MTNGDRNSYTEGDIPPTGPLGLTQPDVYYGQLGNDYSIVGAKGNQREFDGNGGKYVSYSGKGGVSLSNPLTKLAFAVKYKETSFVLNDAVSASGAKIIFNRNPKTRLQKVAPFLTVDGDPYPIVDKSTGHIVWMLDGYTTMANYPYSERQSLSDLTHTSLRQGQRDTQINYIRNSVKATVDAYDGTVTLYQWDAKDPVLKAWMTVFPGLVKPASKMPQDIRDHVRYPQDLFDVQRGLLAQYHITDPVASYNGKGTWAVPPDPFAGGGNQPPYYVLARPPGAASNAAQFQLTTPMVVNGATNLAAYISANSDYGPDYGKLTVLEVSGDSTIYGPSQVANDLKSTAVISKDITQLDTGQSSVLHGNLLTLPVGNSFLYVEPLYVESTGSSAFPTLQRVLVRYGSGRQIGYGSTLEDALDDVRLNRTPGSSISQIGQTTGNGATGNNSSSPPPSTPPASPTSGASSSTPPGGTGSSPAPVTEQQILSQLATIQGKLKTTTGDQPLEIARLQQQQQALIQKLLDLQSKSPTAKSSPSK